MASPETMTLRAHIAPWFMPVMWALIPVFLIVGERMSNRIIASIASKAVDVR